VYHPEVVAASVSRLEQAFDVELWEYTLPQVEEWVQRLDALWDPETETQRRPFKPDEAAFVANERLMGKAGFEYWAERYATISSGGAGLMKLRFWDSQRLILDRIGTIEREARALGADADGVLINVLKARQLGCCLHPATRVLTADLHWIELQNVKVGQALVAVDEFPPGGRGAGRKMRRAVVEGVADVFEPAFFVELDNGAGFIATAPHRFLCLRRGNTATEWRAVGALRLGDSVRYVTKPWGVALYEDGWMGGMLDGEGSLALPSRTGASVTCSQVAGPVYERVCAYLAERGYSWREERDLRKGGLTSKFGQQPLYKAVVGRMDELFRLVGQTRPTRFLARDWWEGKELPGKKSGEGWAKVVRVSALGSQRMIDLQTTTKTFIAEGFVSHNSTLSQAMVAHRITTQADIFALVAGDVPAQSTFIIDMFLRILDHLPWWMRVGLKTRVETFPQELEFITGSHVWGRAGDSTRGENEKKGNLGRGQTVSTLTLTELSTWAHPEQIDDALMPGVPVHPRTLAIFESTAKGTGNWWDKQWRESKRGIGRFKPIFIPWYAEPRKHRRPAPAEWGPSDDTLQHARRCEEGSSYWMGKPLTLTRDQLYWYEQTKATHKLKGTLWKFIEEYPSTDDEAFQVGGHGIFTPETMDRIVTQARPIAAVLDVLPRKDLVLETAEEQGLPAFDLPPGYGFRWREELPAVADLEALEDCLLIWEPPRKTQRYMISVDVSGGVGADRSVVDVTRIGTVEEPDEQVAQFVSAWTTGRKLALIIDAVGHLYRGVEDEAQVAIENNFGLGLGVQDELQIHLGYRNFWIWRVLDARSPEKRYTTRIGFWTNRRTRPLILERFVDAVETTDLVTGYSDLRLNSPHIFHEMRRFIAPPGEGLVMAAAAPGAHDDCIMSAAIGEHCAHTTLYEDGEPTAEKRRRLHEEATHREELAEKQLAKRDFQNTPVTSEFMETGVDTDNYGSSLYTWP